MTLLLKMFQEKFRRIYFENITILQALEITTALLDNIIDKCTSQHIVRVEVKSLRDTRELIEKVGLKEAENFIKDNPHPQLW